MTITAGTSASEIDEDEPDIESAMTLVDQARGGDRDAFGELYRRYHAAVFRYLYYRVGSVTLAEDLAAETFLHAWRSMANFRWQGSDFGAWLRTIARNLTIDHYRTASSRLEHTTGDLNTLDAVADGPEGAVLAILGNEEMVAIIADLPAEQRDCLMMRFLEGLSIAETADILNRTANAVKQLQRRGLRNVAKSLPEQRRA